MLIFSEQAASGSGRTIKMRVTSYGWNDNDPPSAQIAYPKKAGYPTVHNAANEGQGTYDDPITFAADKRALDIGTIIYVPFLRKYFIMEDHCGSAVTAWKQGQYHVDLWMGPQHKSSGGKLSGCQSRITKSSADVIVNPSRNLPVDKTPLFSNDQCTAKLYD